MPASYSHTQSGQTLLLLAGTAIIGVFIFVAVILATASPSQPPIIWGVVMASMVIAVASLWIFSSLHVEVDATTLRWSFGRGVPKFSIPLHEIQEARVV